MEKFLLWNNTAKQNWRCIFHIIYICTHTYTPRFNCFFAAMSFRGETLEEIYSLSGTKSIIFKSANPSSGEATSFIGLCTFRASKSIILSERGTKLHKKLKFKTQKQIYTWQCNKALSHSLLVHQLC